MDKLSNQDVSEVIYMATRTISSTEAQNNFGRLLDDVIQNHTKYVIKRRNVPQAILLGIADLKTLLVASEEERKKIKKIIQELGPVYHLGETVYE